MDKRKLQETRTECKWTTELPKNKKIKIKTKHKADIYQCLFDITNIIHELWLERNTDRHNPIQGQLILQK